MSSDVPERPRKTLTVTRSTSAAKDDSPARKRTGPRARAVAIAERARGADTADQPQTGRAPRGQNPHERSGERHSERRLGGGRPDGERPDGERQRDPRQGGPRHNGPRQGGPRHDGPRHDGPRHDGPRHDGPRRDMPSGRETARPDVNVAARHAEHDHAERFTVFAPCPQGLEGALSAELEALGFADAKPGRAGCSFTADWSGVQRANLYSRLATRMLVRVAHAPMSHEDDVYALAQATTWERWFGAEHTLRVDTSAIRSPVQSLQYCNLRVKDGICDRLRDLEGERPSIDTVRPDARVHLFLTENTATLYLDTSGESLFKRGWRLDKGEAPLRENLAAGMLALAGWDPEQPLLDPFCGSGTLLIEAAWIALGVPPGIARPLGFERLRGHDVHAWDAVKEEAYSRIAPGLDAPIVGYDIDPQAIEFAQRNAERAWLAEDAIRFEQRDARQAERLAPSGWIITNPPYGERLDQSDDELWQEWSGTLKRQFGGWHLHVITSDMAFPQKLRLKPQRRTPLFNGALDCRLFGFDLVEAGFRGTE